jgi:hypothetical protein
VSRASNEVTIPDDERDAAGDEWQSSFNLISQPLHDISDLQRPPQDNWSQVNPVTTHNLPNEDPAYPAPPQEDHSIAQRSVLNNRVMRTIVTSSNDALGLLFQGVEQQNESVNDDRQTVAGRTRAEFQGHVHTDAEPIQHRTPRSGLPMGTTPGQVFQEQLSPVERDILALWNRCRFIKQGWFSAKEAVTYIDL